MDRGKDCAEGRNTVVQTVRTESLNTLLNGCTELDGVARALNMLDVDTQEGIIKAAVKPLVHSSMETSGSERDQPEEDEREETDEHSSE